MTHTNLLLRLLHSSLYVSQCSFIVQGWVHYIPCYSQLVGAVAGSLYNFILGTVVWVISEGCQAVFQSGLRYTMSSHGYYDVFQMVVPW